MFFYVNISVFVINPFELQFRVLCGELLPIFILHKDYLIQDHWTQLKFAKDDFIQVSLPRIIITKSSVTNYG